MERTCNAAMAATPGISENTKEVLSRVTRLVLCIAAILVFMLVIGPKLEQIPALKPIAEFIEERDIDANMYFYTEVEEFSEASINMDNSMMYPPRSMTGQ